MFGNANIGKYKEKEAFILLRFVYNCFKRTTKRGGGLNTKFLGEEMGYNIKRIKI